MQLKQKGKKEKQLVKKNTKKNTKKKKREANETGHKREDFLTTFSGNKGEKVKRHFVVIPSVLCELMPRVCFSIDVRVPNLMY